MNSAIPIIGNDPHVYYACRPLGKRGALATPGKSYDIQFLSVKALLLQGWRP